MQSAAIAHLAGVTTVSCELVHAMTLHRVGAEVADILVTISKLEHRSADFLAIVDRPAVDVIPLQVANLSARSEQMSPCWVVIASMLRTSARLTLRTW